MANAGYRLLENYSQAFTIVVNADHVPLTKVVRDGKTYDMLAFDLVLYFGLPALKADISWKEGDVEKRCVFVQMQVHVVIVLTHSL